jgi:hypothetical protein
VEGTEGEGEGVTKETEGKEGGESWEASFCNDTSSFEESDKSMTSSKPGSVLTLITGGVLKSAVDDRRGVRIFVDSPSWESGQPETLYFPAASSQTTMPLSVTLEVSWKVWTSNPVSGWKISRSTHIVLACKENLMLRCRHETTTKPDASIGKRIGTPMPLERSSTISETGGKVEAEAMKAENVNVKEERWEDP